MNARLVSMAVAIMPFQGYGQEDSVIVNQYALDRGMGRSDHKTVRETLNDKNNEVFQKPAKKRKFEKYDKLDQDGIITPRSEIKREIVLLVNCPTLKMFLLCLQPTAGLIELSCIEGWFKGGENTD